MDSMIGDGELAYQGHGILISRRNLVELAGLGILSAVLAPLIEVPEQAFAATATITITHDERFREFTSDDPTVASMFSVTGGPATGGIAWCTMSSMRYPENGDQNTYYGSLGLPELDYVLYHGYDGQVVTSLYGMDWRRSAAATGWAVFLAVNDQRLDVQTIIGAIDGKTYHGNSDWKRSYNGITDAAVKAAAQRLYQEGMAYKNAGGGGIEAGCATYWRPGRIEGVRTWQALTTAYKRGAVTLEKVSADKGLTDGNSEYTLKGAVYEIHKADTDELVDTVTTGVDGTCTAYVAIGESYYAVETKASKGYRIDKTHHTFTAGLGTMKLSVMEIPDRVRLEIRKVDLETGSVKQGLAWVKGTVIKVEDSKGHAYQGAVDGNGVLRIGYDEAEKLALGTLTVTEVSAPVGYKVDRTPHTIVVHAANA